jgi:hypothetical protein
MARGKGILSAAQFTFVGGADGKNVVNYHRRGFDFIIRQRTVISSGAETNFILHNVQGINYAAGSVFYIAGATTHRSHSGRNAQNKKSSRVT